MRIRPTARSIWRRPGACGTGTPGSPSASPTGPGTWTCGSPAARSEAERERAASLVADDKRVRPLIQHGLLYRLGSVASGHSAVQYLAPDGSQTAVLVFRTAHRFGRPDPEIALRGLDPAARYHDAVSGRLRHGAVLLTPGVSPRSPESPGSQADYASALVHLIRTD
jgi:alpha-galactosidase